MGVLKGADDGRHGGAAVFFAGPVQPACERDSIDFLVPFVAVERPEELFRLLPEVVFMVGVEFFVDKVVCHSGNPDHIHLMGK